MEKRRTRVKKMRRFRKSGRSFVGGVNLLNNITDDQESEILGVIDYLKSQTQLKSDMADYIEKSEKIKSGMGEYLKSQTQLKSDMADYIEKSEKIKSGMDEYINNTEKINSGMADYIEKSEKLVNILAPTPQPATEEKPTEEPTSPTVKDKIENDFKEPDHTVDYNYSFIDDKVLAENCFINEKENYKKLEQLKILYIAWFEHVKKYKITDNTIYDESKMFSLRSLLASLNNIKYDLFDVEKFYISENNKSIQKALFNKLKDTLNPSKINLFYEYIKKKMY